MKTHQDWTHLFWQEQMSASGPVNPYWHKQQAQDSCAVHLRVRPCFKVLFPKTHFLNFNAQALMTLIAVMHVSERETA